jgi:hypothetical protein
VLRISPNGATPGTEFIDVFIPNGSTDAPYYIQGLEGATGGVTITASAPGFTDDTGIGNVYRSTAELVSVPDSTTSLSASTSFFVRIGVVLPGSTSFWAYQEVRAGGTALTATVTHSNPAVAQLVTTAGPAQTRTVTIVPGESNSPTSVAAGGIAFDPLTPGETVVSVSVPGLEVMRSEPVTVSAPAVTLLSLPITVGAGLQYGTFTARLGAPQHGGVTLRIRSSNPEVLRISPNASTPGSEFIDVSVSNGFTDGSYFLQGIEPLQLASSLAPEPPRSCSPDSKSKIWPRQSLRRAAPTTSLCVLEFPISLVPRSACIKRCGRV